MSREICPDYILHRHHSSFACVTTKFHVIRLEPWASGGLPPENVRLSFLIRMKPEHWRSGDNEHHVTWTTNFDFSNATTYNLMESRDLIAAYGGQLHMVPMELTR